MAKIALQDADLVKDRQDFANDPFTREAFEGRKPDARTRLYDGFDLLENTLLSDERTWLFKTEKPSLGEIEGRRSVLTLQVVI